MIRCVMLVNGALIWMFFDAEVKQHENEQLHTLLIQQVLMCNRRSKDRLLIKDSIEKSETI